MKNTFLIFALILCEISLSAQNYHPFPTKNAMWTEMYYKPFFADSPRNVFHGYRIKDQDTTINGKLYSKIFHFYNPDFSDEKLSGGIREENKRVYYYVIDSLSYIGDLDYPPLKTEFLLYDFSLNVGDSISSDSFRITVVDYPSYLKVIKIDSVQFGNEYYRTFQFGRQFSLNPVPEAIWVEGIGTFNGLLYPIGDKSESGSKSTLICFSKENYNLYHNQFFNDCFGINSTKNYINSIKLTIHPKPFNDLITVEYQSSEAAVLEILSAHGKSVFKKEINDSGSTKINLSSLPAGLYLVNLKTGNKTITEKILKN